MANPLGNKTYMETYQQDASFAALLKTLPDIRATLDRVFAQPWDQLIFTGCGSSFYLAQSAAFACSALNATPASAVPCSELYFFPRTYIKGQRTLVLPITRKSYTTEVRMAIDQAHTLPGVSSLAITCDPDSAQYNDFVVLAPDTAEDSVIMTRSFTAMVLMSMVLAMHAGGQTERIDALAALPAAATEALKAIDAMAGGIVRDHAGLDHCVTLGQGVYYGIANECMNKIKEMALCHSEAYHGLEYRHGPMSLADDHTLIMLLSHEDTVAYDQKLMAQLKGFGAVIWVIGANARRNFPQADYALDLPAQFDSLQNAAMGTFVGQFVGHHLALRKGLNADAPRNLTQAIVL